MLPFISSWYSMAIIFGHLASAACKVCDRLGTPIFAAMGVKLCPGACILCIQTLRQNGLTHPAPPSKVGCWKHRLLYCTCVNTYVRKRAHMRSRLDFPFSVGRLLHNKNHMGRTCLPASQLQRWVTVGQTLLAAGLNAPNGSSRA